MDLTGRRKTNDSSRNTVLRRDSKEQTNATDKNLNHGFEAYLRRVDNPDKDRVVLKREGMRQEGDNSDSKGLGVEGHHIRCSRLARGLDHRDLDQDRCMKDRLALDDSDHPLYHDNRLFRVGRPCHH